MYIENVLLGMKRKGARFYFSRNIGENCRNDQNQPVKMNFEYFKYFKFCQKVSD